jgi:hypothetical protein
VAEFSFISFINKSHQSNLEAPRNGSNRALCVVYGATQRRKSRNPTGLFSILD